VLSPDENFKEMVMRRRKVSSLPISAEICESRTLLAGSATASFANGVLTVDIHSGGKVRIYEHDPGVFWVSSIGTTPINGQVNPINGQVKPFVVTGLTNIVVNMDAAASYDTRNVLRLGYEGNQFSAFPGNVTVNMGGDYNRLYFENSSIAGNVTIYQNSEDYVDFEQATVSGTIQYIPIP
jgi:hypothetical protein